MFQSDIAVCITLKANASLTRLFIFLFWISHFQLQII